MPAIAVNQRVVQGALSQVPYGHSIGTDNCSIGVGMIARMSDGSSWCAHFNCSLPGTLDQLAAIQAATFSTLSGALRSAPLSLDACTGGQLKGGTAAIWAGIQQYFNQAKNRSSTLTDIKTGCNGIYADRTKGVRCLGAAEHLSGHPAPSNSKATVPPPLQGFDTDSVLDEKMVLEFVSRHYGFCLRYLSHEDNASKGDLSADEALLIRQHGLGLMLVQHVRFYPWSPTGALGKEYGQYAVAHAQTVGIPHGVSVWMDLENVNIKSAAQAVIDYCNAWFLAVKDAGYSPGLYVGANSGLSGEQLYQLPFQAYWKSISSVPDIPGRGYQMVQSIPPKAVSSKLPIAIDSNYATTDNKGGYPQLWPALLPS